jgi:hypothetical protein
MHEKYIKVIILTGACTGDKVILPTAGLAWRQTQLITFCINKKTFSNHARICNDHKQIAGDNIIKHDLFLRTRFYDS